MATYFILVHIIFRSSGLAVHPLRESPPYWVFHLSLPLFPAPYAHTFTRSVLLCILDSRLDVFDQHSFLSPSRISASRLLFKRIPTTGWEVWFLAHCTLIVLHPPPSALSLSHLLMITPLGHGRAPPMHTDYGYTLLQYPCLYFVYIAPRPSLGVN